MSGERSVLCVSKDPCDPSVLEALARGGWRVQHECAQGGRFTLVTDCEVGIVCIDDKDAVWLDLLRANAGALRNLELVAILAPGVLEYPPVREFIAIHCIDYQTRPISAERLLFALGHAQGMATIAQQVREAPSTADGATVLIGDSPVIRQLRREIDKVAQSPAPVFISGESGSGKELVARAIHGWSMRFSQPLIAVNCVSLSPSLIHAELFGYEKGAFTGAHRRSTGHLESADRGTIFLDEIGDLDLDLQALLLRFLEEKSIRRVGGRDEVPLDVRVIAATHVDIEAAVRAGRFRDDLYYRLNVLRIHVPPLRERAEDLPLLAHAFLARFGSDRRERLPRGFTNSALEAMKAYSWPGNVRELINRVRRAIAMCEGPLISAADLQLACESQHHTVHNLVTARNQAEREALGAALHQANWNPSEAAALLGVSRATFYRLVARHNLSLDNSPSSRR
jgi:DNA-binding NtrC family response regulator